MVFCIIICIIKLYVLVFVINIYSFVLNGEKKKEFCDRMK